MTVTSITKVKATALGGAVAFLVNSIDGVWTYSGANVAAHCSPAQGVGA